MGMHTSHVVVCASPRSTRGFAHGGIRAVGIGLIAAICSLYGQEARADLSDPTVLAQLNPLEQLAARANQAVFNALTAAPAAGGGPICGANLAAPAGNCVGNVFNIFSRVRELVDTANVIGNKNGQRLYSLGLDARGLGQALRWTAAEELSAQGTSSTEFSNNQLGSLANRIAALRQGSRGFRVAMNNVNSGGIVAYAPDSPLGGAAGADDQSLASPWGGFVDGSYGYGRKADTTNSGGYEDAYAFDDTEVSAGVDYRFSPNFIAGAIFGYTKKRVDFNPTESTTDGRIRTNGGSLMGYGLFEAGDFYLSGSVGWQRLKHDFVRRIAYPSFNPLVASVNETAASSTNSNVLLATFGVGYDLRFKALTIEPYLNADYQRIDISAFTEAQAGGFDFQYAQQIIKSLDGSIGLKLQYVFTPRFGVIVPYIRGEMHKEFDDKQRQVSAVYAALASVGLATASNANFDIPTDQRKDTYGVVAGGMSVVFKHGLQAFVQYQQIVKLTTIQDRVISGGLRYEF